MNNQSAGLWAIIGILAVMGFQQREINSRLAAIEKIEPACPPAIKWEDLDKHRDPQDPLGLFTKEENARRAK